MHDYEWFVKYLDDDHLWPIDLGPVSLSHVLEQFRRASLAGAVAGRKVLGMWLIVHRRKRSRLAAVLGCVPPEIESRITARTTQWGRVP